MPPPPKNSQKLKDLAVICSLLVVMLHAGLGMSAGEFWYRLLAQGIGNIAVPFFFVVSGYFLANHMNDRGWWKHAVSKRVKTLLVPALIWSLLTIAAYAVLNIVANLVAGRNAFSSLPVLETDWLLHFGLDLSVPPGLVTLWYIRALFILILFSSGIKLAVMKFNGWWLVVCLFVMSVAHECFWYLLFNQDKGYLVYGFPLFGSAFFISGIMIRIKIVYRTNRVLEIAALIIGISLLITQAVVGCRWILLVALPFLVYSYWIFIPTLNLPGFLTSSSFAVFLIHPIVLTCCDVIMRGEHCNGVVCEIVKMLCGVILPIVVLSCLRIVSVPFARVLFGGRV